ncbi:AAA family ATPase [Salinarimonas soli]|uniref:AAA family ATPase n=1 Tax=Salinarimonas soli TaxID=1638099 RepID=A0A5B2V991_9HYPH|nr:AAA family ATPase [Salinarimonas soli]KAA2234909.1 AAA family ATPase [Salinarimonas soli]
MIDQDKTTLELALDTLTGLDEPSDAPATSPRLAPATITLARHALEAAIPAAWLRRLTHGTGSAAVVIQAPTADWTAPLAQAIKALWSDVRVIARDGTSARFDHRSDKGNDHVAARLGEGGRVVGIAPVPAQHLPSALTCAADLTVVLDPTHPAVLRRVIRRATGRSAGPLPAGLGVGLSYSDLVSAIRVGSTPTQCVRRLEAASRALLGGDDRIAAAPLLSELHGYGLAMDHCLAVVDALEAWRRGEASFSSVPRSLLLSSVPGLGKTTLIRSLSASARCPIHETNVGSWFASTQGHLGDVVRAADQAFNHAVALGRGGPAILHLDEIDALPSRASIDADHASWWSPLIGLLLTRIERELSDPRSRLIICASTNHPQRLDEALVRPGRLSPTIHITLPTAADLAEILRSHLKQDLAGEDLRPVAALGAGATGAQAAAWVGEARETARAAGRPMRMSDLMAVVAPPDDRDPADRWRTAVHEAGHGLAAALLEAGTVESLSILPGGTSHGHTIIAPRTSVTRADLEANAMVGLGGRAAEEVLLGRASAGAHSDLEAVTGIVASIHGSFGLGESLLHRGRDPTLLLFDPGLREIVDGEIRRLYLLTVGILEEHADLLEIVARALLADRIMAGRDLQRLVDGYRPPAPHRRTSRGGGHAV